MSDKHEYDRYWNIKGQKVIECKTCGYKHIDPIPAKEAVESFYRDNYHEDVKPFDYEISQETVDQRLEWAKVYKTHNDICDRVSELLSMYNPSSKRSMIDIGSGNSLLTVCFKNKGWETSVLELSTDAARYLGRFGLKVYNASVEDVDALPVKDAALINMQFVIEHLRNPAGFLEKAYDALAPGGVLRILAPNDFSPGQLAYQEYYNEQLHWVTLPDHINYFTFESLSGLLKRYGFEEKYRTTNFPLEFLLLGGMNYYASPEEQKRVGPFVANFENALNGTGRGEILGKLYESLAHLNLGRAIEIYAIKI